MHKVFKKKSPKHGMAPGSIVHVGEKRMETVRLTAFDYNEKSYTEQALKTPEETFQFKEKATASWVNVDGLHDVGAIEKIGLHFGLHPLVMEDIVNTNQRPKLEIFDDYIFLVFKMIRYEEAKNELLVEQVSLVLGRGFVLSFQEYPGDVFDPVRDRIRNAKGKVRKHGADYLAYVLVDAVVDAYYSALEHVGDEIDRLETRVDSAPSPEIPRAIHALRNDLLQIRRHVWPMREILGGLQRSESELLEDFLHPYLSDVHDHSVQVIDAAELLREMVSGLRDTYLSGISLRMNAVMQVLTIISTIFIPLTFIAGVYGMNFDNMPELHWRWGYYATLGVMALVALFMIRMFRKRKWL
jgi:magnesium transporter